MTRMILPTPGATAHDGRARWTGELVAGLDWKRIVELARALCSRAGFRLGKVRTDPDGTAEYVMSLGNGGAEQRSLVRLARWNHWTATGGCLRRFAADLATFQGHHGMFLAPGGFSQAALQTARESGIETIDAGLLAQRLEELPEESRDFYFEMATGGDAATPSCPVCLRSLVLIHSGALGAADLERLPDFLYRGSDMVAAPVIARRVEVLGQCEVHFLQGVHTCDLVVHGVAEGDFHCRGNVVLHAGAILSGNVAARSVIVRPGAELAAQTRILDGAPETPGPAAATHVWRCQESEGRPACRMVAMLPH